MTLAEIKELRGGDIITNQGGDQAVVVDPRLTQAHSDVLCLQWIGGGCTMAVMIENGGIDWGNFTKQN